MPVPGPIKITGRSRLLGNLKSGFLLIKTGIESGRARRSCKHVVVTPSLALFSRSYLTTAAVTLIVVTSFKTYLLQQ